MSLASYHCSTPGSLLGGWGGCPRGCRLRLASAVPLENSRGGELSQLVPDHIFRNEQLQKLPAVMHQKSMADEIGHNRAVARPGLQGLPMAAHALNFFQQAPVNIWPFSQRTTHPVQ